MAKNGVKAEKKIFFSINWKNYLDRSILVISMTVLQISCQDEIGADESRHFLPVEVWQCGACYLEVITAQEEEEGEAQETECVEKHH